MTKWRIDYHFINDEGYIVTTQFKHEYFNFDEAHRDYLAYIRIGGFGWYDLIEITEKVIPAVGMIRRQRKELAQ